MRGLRYYFLCVMLLLLSSNCIASDFEWGSGLRPRLNHEGYVLDLGAKVIWRGDQLEIGIGKNQINWGKGETGTLIFPPTAPTMYNLSYQLNKGPFYYERLMSPLEEENNRWLFGHRFSALWEHLKLSAWEITLCSQEIFPGYYVPIPFVPFYLIQHLSSKLSNRIFDYNTNIMIGFDFQYSKPEIGELYGELLVDDFPQKQENNNPRKIGGLIGLKWYVVPNQLDLWLEYVRINNFVYTHKNPLNRYLYDGQSLGYWLGMDGDVKAVGANYQINLQNYMTFQINFIRKGEGEFEDNWNWQYHDQYEFLSGIVEKSTQLLIGYTYQVADPIQLQVKSIVGSTQNKDHIQNQQGNYFSFAIAVNYQWGNTHVFR